MPVYEYHCMRCGTFECLQSLREQRDAEACPACGGNAPRRMSAPYIARVSGPVRALLDQSERSRHEPSVVRRDDGRGADRAAPQRSGAARDPRLAKLAGRGVAGRMQTLRHPADPTRRRGHAHGAHPCS